MMMSGPDSEELSREAFCALARQAIEANMASAAESGVTDPAEVYRAFCFDFPLVQPHEADALSRSLLRCARDVPARLPTGVLLTPRFRAVSSTSASGFGHRDGIMAQ